VKKLKYEAPIYLGRPIFGTGKLRVYLPKVRYKKKVLWCEMPVLVTGWMWHGEVVDMTHHSLQ
jgi:hypothetical protein